MCWETRSHVPRHLVKTATTFRTDDHWKKQQDLAAQASNDQGNLQKSERCVCLRAAACVSLLSCIFRVVSQAARIKLLTRSQNRVSAIRHVIHAGSDIKCSGLEICAPALQPYTTNRNAELQLGQWRIPSMWPPHLAAYRKHFTRVISIHCCEGLRRPQDNQHTCKIGSLDKV